ncbi:DUF4062 domain-containing protein [Cohnella silvisoli]|uniref:DUF4062 domain-containing protein n=1 Tax=Cohnella silvisoli TaxID=2873699 RepID=A0ABV1KL26_9BACL|nr:DUF4062 domain-containing protein [Cohnella silvisoli]MCD9020819.1 DUF4062 domain-containing protein [Cohnella silvisoli]
MAKTKIFISSVNEDGLKRLRKEAFTELRDLGHEPLMWEQNLGPWPANIDPVVKCLEAVDEADIFLLFIGNNGGTYYKDAQRTVTHMEFIKAYDKGKTILIFVDTTVKNIFFETVKRWMDEFLEQYISESHQHPSPEVILSALKQNPDIPNHIDAYVWFLLHDLTIRNVYLDDLSLGVRIDWKEYFSDLLRRGSMLLPLQHSIVENGRRLEQSEDAFRLLSELSLLMQTSEKPNYESILRAIMNKMSGGIIEQQYGQYMSEVIGSYKACIGATLYVNDNDKMKYVAKCADVAWNRSFRLDDQSSYVALTYNMNKDTVHYTQAKQMFYYCFKRGKYVLTLHFPSESDWDNRKYMIYQESVNDAIINKNPYLVEIIKMILGGMQP